MEKKLLVTIILVVIASLSIAGCTSSSTPASPTPTAAASSANSPTPSVATQTQASPTPRLTVATPANVPTATPTPAIGTWSGSLKVDNPPNTAWDYPQGSSVSLDAHLFKGTSTPLVGATVIITSNGQTLATAVTNSNGDAYAVISTGGWSTGYHSINASYNGSTFAATGFSVIAAK